MPGQRRSGELTFNFSDMMMILKNAVFDGFNLC